MKFDVSQSGGFHLEFDVSMLEDAVNAGAKVLEETTKQMLAGNRDTGDLIASVSAGAAKYKPKYGGYYAPIRFVGTGSNGTRNGLKAAELEYGNTRQTASPFADRSVHAAESRAAEVMSKIAEDRWVELNE
jgi:hypothetical protein